MKFVKVAANMGDGIALVNLSKVEVITYNDEGYPVLWDEDEASWTCPTQSLEDCIVEI